MNQSMFNKTSDSQKKNLKDDKLKSPMHRKSQKQF